jgi:acyl transferase domain-containing protein/non-ribosomal peptide synthetase component F/thioesterase domain-containing protein/acyl carrier protein
LVARARAVLNGSPVPEADRGEQYRLAVVGSGPDALGGGLAEALERVETGAAPRFALTKGLFFASPEAMAPRNGIALMFPGFGVRRPSLLADLTDRYPSAREWHGRLPEARRARLAANPFLSGSGHARPAGLGETIEAMLAGNLCMHALLGAVCPDLRPSAMVGHSFGEIALLSAARMLGEAEEAFGFADRLQALVYRNSPAHSGTAMIAIPAAGRPVLQEARHRRLSLALDNCPQQSIYCGPRVLVAELDAALKAAGIVSFQLTDLTVPVHTPDFPVPRDELAGSVAQLSLLPPDVRAYSCADAAPFPSDRDSIRTLLVDQWLRPMRFRETIERMHADGIDTFLEVGPGGHLTGFVRDILRGAPISALATNMEKRDTAAQLDGVLARLFVKGIAIDTAPPSLRPAAPASISTRAPEAEPAAMEALVSRLVAEILELDPTEPLDGETGFFDLGMGSVQAVAFAERLAAAVGRPLDQTLAFDYPSIRSLARHLGDPRPTASPTARRGGSGEIAIVGMGCRFPGAPSPDSYWELLRTGADSVSRLPEDRWDLAELRASGIDPDATPHIFHGGFLEEIRDFDSGFFGISAREADTLDPQQRLLLEVARETLEAAGIAPSGLQGSATGIFVGICHTDYSARIPMVERLAIGGYLGTGNAHSTAAGRLAFVLGTQGPCIALDTACSSSLTAVHQAAASLRSGECDLALAGGVNLLISPETSIALARAEALSPTGRSRAFDANADGYVRGEGCGMVALKRVEDALEAGDRILAVISGSALNHDGRTSGLTVPNGPAQQQLIVHALADAGIGPDDLDYVEAHGTGTPLGDPIEIRALGAVFSGRPPGDPLLVGAAKTNFGHLEAASGIAGLIKTILQIEHGFLVPTLHGTRPNPRIDWEKAPFAVVREGRPWPERGRRIAGVSSFGISGTNAHVVLAAPPESLESPAYGDGASAPRSNQILALSARSPGALEVLRKQAAERLGSLPDGDFADACATSLLGRDHLEHRLTVVADNPRAAAEQLARVRPAAAARRSKVAFLYSGQGAQVPGMGRELYAAEPAFRAAVDDCAAHLDPLLDIPVTDLMFRDGMPLDRTANTQPALFAFEFALDRLLAHWGVRPDMVVGHSIGDYVAAWRSNAIALGDAARLVAARGRLMQSLPAGGAMLAAALSEDSAIAVLERTDSPVEIAAVNSAQSVVFSGDAGAIGRLKAALEAGGIRARALPVSHAFHSRLMDPILGDFHSIARSVVARPPTLPWLSNLTGAPHVEAPGAEYWTAQLRSAVRFADGMATLRSEGCATFVEIGPRPVLTAAAREDTGKETWIAPLSPRRLEVESTLSALGDLHCAGVPVDWASYHGCRPWRRTAMPTTPFERRRHWIDRPGRSPGIAPPGLPAPAPAAPSMASPLKSARLAALPLQERRTVAAHELRRTLASVLGGGDPHAMDGAIVLNRFGLDSLMALGLRRELADEYGVEISVARLVGDTSLDDLTELALARVAIGAGEAPAPAVAGPPRRPGDPEISPLSYGQRALWFLWNLAPDSSAYTLTLPLEIPAASDSGAWRLACGKLVAAHPMLRAVFRRMDDDVVQQVLPPGEIDWRSIDARAWDSAALAEAAEAAHSEPFVLDTGRVVRFRWFDLPEGGARLILSMHHIVSDGWSLEVIRRDLFRIARGASMAEATGYFDHVSARLTALEGEEGTRLWDYWRGVLAGPLPVLDLPTDLPRPAEKGFRGGGVRMALPEGFEASVARMSRTAGTTRYLVHLALFTAFLHRFSGQDDLIVGSPQAGRTRAEVAHLVGYFVDPLVVRSQIRGTESFTDYLRMLRGDVLGAIEHSEFPFALLVERLRPPRDPSRSPLFDASFNFVSSAPGGADDRIAVGELPQADGKFDITLTIRDGDAASGWLGYDSALFTQAGAEALAGAFCRFAAAILAEPDVPFLALGGDSPALSRGPGSSEPQVLHDLLAHWAGATPGAQALVAVDGALDYRALARRVGRLAQAMRATGAAPGTLFGLVARRDTHLIATLVAAQQAGMTPVLLSADWPPALRERVVADNRIGYLWDAGELSRTSAGCQARPGSAYVIFTSGTAGTAKGVVVSQAALSIYTASIVEDLGLGDGGRFAMVSSPAADLGLTMVVASLATGGCLYLVPEATCLDDAAFNSFIARNAIDHLKIAPSHLAALTAAGLKPNLRTLILGGESARPDWVAQFAHPSSGCRIFNHYGPTETTIGVLTGAFEPSGFASSGLPLNRPVLGARIDLLDPQGRPVMRGAVGEVVVSGPTVAEGYLDGQSGGFESTEAGRRYRTGDLARQRPDGSLELLGRRDRQLKLRGYRIDPGQIEAALGALPGVGRASVTTLAGPAGEPRLVGHVAVTGAVSAAALRRDLADRLPPVMVPDRILLHDALPITANGKVDVAALERMATGPVSQDSRPRDPVETTLCTLWREVLNLDQVGIDDDFFAFGGHSLLAVRLVARIERTLGVRIPVAALLGHPTVAELGALVRDARQQTAHPLLLPLSVAAEGAPVYLLPGAGGSPIYLRELAQHVSPARPCWGLRGIGEGPDETIPQSVEEIAEIYAEAIALQAGKDPIHLAGHSFGALVAVEVARALMRRGHRIGLLALLDNAAPGLSPETREEPEARSEIAWLGHIALRIGKLSGIALDLAAIETAPGGYRGAIDALASQMVAVGLLPEEVDNAGLVRFIEIYKANAKAAANYAPSPLGEGVEAHIFRASEADPTLGNLDAGAQDDLGWGRYFRAAPTTSRVEGTHLTMFVGPNAERLGRLIGAAIVDSEEPPREVERSLAGALHE